MPNANIVIEAAAPFATVRADQDAHRALFSLCQPVVQADYSDPVIRRMRRSGWNGRWPFYKWGGGVEGRLPVGLVPFAWHRLADAGIAAEVHDLRGDLPAADLLGVPARVGARALYPYQLEAAEDGLAATRGMRDVTCPGFLGGLGVYAACTGSGKTTIMAALLSALGMPTGLVLVPKANLVAQLRDELGALLGQEHLGRWAGGTCDGSARILVATVQSVAAMLTRDPAQALALLKRQVLLLDEAHHLVGDTDVPGERGQWSEVVESCPASWRLAFSGTPLTKSTIQNWELIGQFGPVVAQVEYAKLVREGYLAKPVFMPVAFPEPIFDGGYERSSLASRASAIEAAIPQLATAAEIQTAQGEAARLRERIRDVEPGKWGRAPYNAVRDELIERQPARDAAVADIVGRLVAANLKTLVMVRGIEHGKALAAVIQARAPGLPVCFLSGQYSALEQGRMLREFRAAPLGVMVANKVAGEGTDIPDVRALVLTAGGKDYVGILQRLGRGIRRKEGDNRVLVVDCMDFGHRMLADHARARILEYEAAGVASGVFELLGAVTIRTRSSGGAEAGILAFEERLREYLAGRTT